MTIPDALVSDFFYEDDRPRCPECRRRMEFDLTDDLWKCACGHVEADDDAE